MDSYAARETPGQWRSHTRDTINSIHRYVRSNILATIFEAHHFCFMFVLKVSNSLHGMSNKTVERHCD